MSKIFARVFLVLFVMLFCLSSSDGFRRGGKGYGNKESGKPKTGLIAGSSGINQNTTRKGLGISAWGLITLVVFLILAVTGMYYFSICYPILCKKTRKYDIIGLPEAV